jgi:hypothetical protein
MSDYIISHEGKQFTPNGRLKETVNATERNARIEKRQLEAWAMGPQNFSGYISDGKFSTWLGAELGTVYETRQLWTTVGSGKLTHYRIRGNNGASYYGKHGDMQLLRVRRFVD